MPDKLLNAALSAALVLTAATQAVAAGFPERPVRMVAASATGGGTDIIARLLAHPLTEKLGQQVVVDNRPGSGGIIATDIVAKAPADGHTLLAQGFGITFAPALYRKLPFDVKRDITAVTIMGSQPFILAVHAGLPVTSVADLVRLARSKPGTIRFASGGVGGGSHIGSELFRVIAGIQLVHVPYKGTGPGTTALLSGEVQMGIAGVSTMLPHARSGRVRALAVTGAKRSPAAPDLPTVAENGLPGYAFDVWYGLFAPSKIPRAILARLNRDATAALRDADAVKRFSDAGIEIIGGTLADSNRYMLAEMDKWAKTIRDAGIKAN